MAKYPVRSPNRSPKSSDRSAVNRVATGPFSTSAAGKLPLAVDAGDSIPTVVVDAPARHPHLFAKRVVEVDPAIRPGATVVVQHRDGNLLGYGTYNPKSEIRVRLICGQAELPDDDFWNRLFERAVSVRQKALKLDAVTNAYRVVHAEADGFSGLVVDRYGDVLSGEAFSLGAWQRGQEALMRLATCIGLEHWTLRCGPQTLAHEGFAADPVSSPNCPQQTTVQEFGTRFRVRFAGGHKTGFFCDQRENRRRLAEFAAGRSVLDLCCYTGGFAVQAMALGKAASATAVDLDESALAVAKENANLNQVRVDCVHADAFAYMRDMERNGRKFGAVVLDPPKLIRSRAEIEEGAKRHYDLNRLAFGLVEPGGLLLTCTCAGLFGRDDFERTVANAARKTGRNARIVAIAGAASDHPIAIDCPETRYLHAMFLIVD